MSNLPGTKVLSGKNLTMQFTNPSAGANPPSGGFATLANNLHIDKFEYSPKVNSSKYASSMTSGYNQNTSGTYEADGSFDILIDPTGTLSGASGSAGLGMKIDDFIDANVYTTTTLTNANFAGRLHIDSMSKPIETNTNKLKVTVKFTVEGIWVEN